MGPAGVSRGRSRSGRALVGRRADRAGTATCSGCSGRGSDVGKFGCRRAGSRRRAHVGLAFCRRSAGGGARAILGTSGGATSGS